MLTIIEELSTIIRAVPSLAEELARLQALFVRMDDTYGQAAAHYGFACSGCQDNCCLTRFYHHTAAEVALLFQGMKGLGAGRRKAVKARSQQVISHALEMERSGRSCRIMCPLNERGLCILYEQRPMICRLHGIPHELRRPDSHPVRGPGCEAFTRQCGRLPYVVFDRTPFYIELAGLEQTVRLKMPAFGKVKLTVAEMIAGFEQVDGL